MSLQRAEVKQTSPLKVQIYGSSTPTAAINATSQTLSTNEQVLVDTVDEEGGQVAVIGIPS